MPRFCDLSPSQEREATNANVPIFQGLTDPFAPPHRAERKSTQLRPTINHEAHVKRALQSLTTLLLTAALGFAQDSYVAARQSALVLEQEKNFTEAETAWQSLAHTYPNNPEPYARIALLEARQEHYSQAIPLYRRALDLKPDLPDLRLNLALALFKGSQLKEAVPEFETLLKAAPADSPEAQRVTILLGMSHYGLAEYDKAAPYLKTAADHDPQSLPLRLALAHTYLWTRQFPKVMEVYKEILALNPDSAEADMIAGEALDEMKDNEGSTKMFRAAVKANPKEPNAHFGLGYLLWAQKQYPEAAAEFQAELANDPSHAQSMLYLGDTFLQLNKAEEARPLLAHAVQLDPALWLGSLDLGVIDSDAGRNQDALSELETAAKLKPDEVNVHWRLGRLFRALGRKDEAKSEFDKASKLNKAADDDLYKKINSGQQQPAQQRPDPQ
jgi:tetratricopeptide (TPR) repeat protein